MTNVEVGQATPERGVEEGEDVQGGPERVPSYPRRARVDALGEGIGRLELQAVAHRLRQLDVQAVIARAGRPDERAYLPQGRVDSRSAALGRRPHVAGRGQRGLDDVHVIRVKWLVHAAGPHIADGHGQAGEDLPLHVQVPLQHVVALGLLLDVPEQEAVPGQERIGSARERPRRQRAQGAELEEWGRLQRDQGELVWQRKVIVDADGAPDRGLAAGEWIPREAHARFEVPERRVLVEGRAQLRLGIGEIDQGRELAIRFRGDGGDLVA